MYRDKTIFVVLPLLIVATVLISIYVFRVKINEEKGTPASRKLEQKIKEPTVAAIPDTITAPPETISPAITDSVDTAGTISGKVQTEDGQPIEDALIIANYWSGEDTYAYFGKDEPRAISDADGTFKLVNLPKEGVYHLWITAKT